MQPSPTSTGYNDQWPWHDTNRIHVEAKNISESDAMMQYTFHAKNQILGTGEVWRKQAGAQEEEGRNSTYMRAE